MSLEKHIFQRHSLSLSNSTSNIHQKDRLSDLPHYKGCHRIENYNFLLFVLYLSVYAIKLNSHLVIVIHL